MNPISEVKQFFKPFPDKGSVAYLMKLSDYKRSGDMDTPAYIRLGKNVQIKGHSHAMSDHPDTAPQVRKAIDQCGIYVEYEIRHNRWLRVVILDEARGVIGFQIVDVVNGSLKERTAYVKDTIKNISQLVDYANRMGYSIL